MPIHLDPRYIAFMRDGVVREDKPIVTRIGTDWQRNWTATGEAKEGRQP